MPEINLPSTSAMLSKDFLFGVATSSFQIEGDRGGRLDCIWDTFCAEENTISDSTNGDIACDHVKLWKQDIELIDSLGLDAYRLSISWPRVMNQDGTINEVGMQFYVNLVNEVIERGMKVFVTLYHWDLPHHFEMLPYGLIYRHGAPSIIRDIDLGTHMHGIFFLGKQGMYKVPLLETQYFQQVRNQPNQYSPDSPYNQVLRLEDDFSFYLRQKATWQITHIDQKEGKLTCKRKDNGKERPEGLTGTQVFDFDSLSKTSLTKAPTSRPRSPINPTTTTSAVVYLLIMPNRTDLPTPEPAIIPIR